MNDPIFMSYREIKQNRIARFHGKIRKDSNTGCWLWTGAQTGNGYGQASYEGKVTTAHRAYWLCAKGPLPENVDLDHRCRNRLCVNPDHLEPVTRSTNLRRGFESRGCVNGHVFSLNAFSVVRRKSGRIERRCKICHRARNKKAKAAKKQKAAV